MTASTRMSSNTGSVADEMGVPSTGQQDEEAARPEDVADHDPIVLDRRRVRDRVIGAARTPARVLRP